MKAFLVVNALHYAREGLPRSEICARTSNPRQTVSSVAKRLEGEGLASTKGNPDDKRNRIVSLAEDGCSWVCGMHGTPRGYLETPQHPLVRNARSTAGPSPASWRPGLQPRRPTSHGVEACYANPFELGWSKMIDGNHDFIGKEALRAQRGNVRRDLWSLLTARRDQMTS